MKTPFLLAALLLTAAPLAAQVPNLIPHQGRVAVNGVNFDGTGQFKFALVNAAGTTTYWSNNGSSTVGSQPTAAVSLPVTKGLYSAMLGDTSLANMTAVPASVFSNADLRLRVWFNNGTLGFQQLTPDQRLAPNGYLPDGAVTSAKLAPGAAIPGVKVSSSTQDALPNTNYIATGGGTTTFHLPESAAIGDVVNISGSGAGSVSISDPYAFTARNQPWAWRAVASSSDGAKLIAAPQVGQLATSADGGVTWTSRDFSRNWYAVASSSDGTKLIAGAFNDQLYTSTDAGVTWTPREQMRFWRAVASSADGTKLIAAANGGRLYTSTDAGLTWTPREQNRDWYSVASSSDGMNLAAAAMQGQLYTSTDAGVTWTPREQVGNWVAVASSFDGTKLIAAVSGGRLFTSADAGLTWTPREQNRDWYSVASSADGAKLIAAVNGGRLYTSTDAGVTWTPREQHLNWLSAAMSADGRKMIAAAYGDRLYVSGEILHLPGTGSASLTYGNAGWALTSPGGWTPSRGNLYRNSGNIGIGTATPNYPLSFGASAADTLLALYDPGTFGAYGLGIGSGQFRLHLGEQAGRFSFLDAPQGFELMTVRGDGRVGILETNPSSTLHVNGIITGNGSGLTNLNAASLTGTLGAAQLPAAVALRSGGNAFTGTQTVTGGGRLGVGTGSPNYPLSFGTGAANTLLALYDPGPAGAYGLGIGSGQFRLHLGESTARFSFLNAPAGSELLTIHGSGRVGIGTTDPGAKLTVIGDSGAGGIAGYSSTVNSAVYGENTFGGFGVAGRTSGTGYAVYGDNTATGGWAGYFNGNVRVTGTINPPSDRNLKHRFGSVDPQRILEKVAALNIGTWVYKNDAGHARHLGPVAQDFRAAFGLGADETSIATVDADGVALAAIQGLNQKLGEREKEIAALKTANELLTTRLEKLERALDNRQSPRAAKK